MDKKQFVEMESILVSIIIPVYNAEKTIGRCLESLIGQTYPYLEIICVNDCSKDSSFQVLQGFASKDSRVRIINHNENRNAGGARNTGIKSANGHYICFVDNDDWISVDAIQKLVNSSNNGSADLVASDWISYFSDDKQVYNNNLLPDASLKDNKEYVIFHGFRMLGCLWKKDIFIANNLFFPENIFFEDNAVGDTIFWYANKISYVQLPLYFYYISSTSVTGFVTKRKITDRITTTELYFANLKHHGFYEQDKDLFDYYGLKLCFTTIMMLSRYSFNSIREDFIRNKSIIERCLPNVFLDRMSFFQRVAIKHTKSFYWSMRLFYPLVPVLLTLRNFMKK